MQNSRFLIEIIPCLYQVFFIFGILAALSIHILKKFQLNLGNGVPHRDNHSTESLVCSTGFIFQAEILN